MSDEFNKSGCAPSDCASCTANCESRVDEAHHTITLTMDDDTEVECAILTIFPVENKEYIAKMQALRMKREPALPELLRVALLIHSAIFTRIKRAFTPGGPTVSVHERRTPAGVSTISLFPLP